MRSLIFAHRFIFDESAQTRHAVIVGAHRDDMNKKFDAGMRVQVWSVSTISYFLVVSEETNHVSKTIYSVVL